MRLIYYGKVKETGLHINNRARFDKEVMNFLDKEVVITIEKKVYKRSLPQNSYLHGVVIPMFKDGLNDVGYIFSLEMTKQKLKEMFAQAEMVNEKTGEYISYIKDTSAMTKGEMMDFIAQIQQWASEFLNIYIPDPNEVLTINFDEP